MEIIINGTEWCQVCGGPGGGCTSCFDGYLPSRQEVGVDEENRIALVYRGTDNFWPNEAELPGYARKEVTWGEFVRVPD